MKARFLITVITTLFVLTINFAQEKMHCPPSECAFQPGDQAYAFGHKIKLRAEPNTSSAVLEELKIGEWVKILEKTPFSWPYKGFDSPFYKVNYNGMTGYILGGLLSMERKTVAGQHYFFTYSQEGETTFLNIRTVVHGSYMEKKVPLRNPHFTINTLGSKGVPNLDGILYVDYQANASNLDDGGIYLFLNHFNLCDAVAISEVVDQGSSNYLSERLIFPDDSDGIPNKVLYKMEKGENLDLATEWRQTSMESRILTWADGTLSPNIREKRKIP
jgi:Bacterial SH3 domain.